MAKVCTTVNLLNPDFQLVTLVSGDEIPEWATELIKNPAVLGSVTASDETEPLEQPTVPAAVKVEDYKAGTKAELTKVAAERGLTVEGLGVKDIRALLVDDDAAKADAAAGSNDVFDLEREQLEELADKRNVEYDENTSDDELAQLIDNAGE